MSLYIVIRESREQDTPAISEVVRNAYTSLVFDSWMNALLSEVTFQLIILIAALMFIVFGFPLTFCLCSIPIVLVMMYVIIYGSFLMKSAQIMYDKKPLKCWVAEVYEPFFFTKKPDECRYKIVSEEEIRKEDVVLDGAQRKIVGTISVMKHFQKDDWVWLFRLAVDNKYRRKGVALRLIKTVQEWSRHNKYNNLELVISECQDGARQLFNEAGFDLKQIYHKKLFTSAFTLQMSQLRCEVRHTF